MKPFMLQAASQFRSDPPPALSSTQWAEGFNEVKAYGAANSTVRTPAQTAVGLFWNAHVINQYNQAFRELAVQHGFDLVDTVRLLAMGNLVGADAGIGCLESKYHYAFWRPVTAIRSADIDGNPLTQPDPTWTPCATSTGSTTSPTRSSTPGPGPGSTTAGPAFRVSFWATRRPTGRCNASSCRRSRAFLQPRFRPPTGSPVLP